MPLDVVRIRDSEAVVVLTAEEFRAAFLLWCAAWHQVPAASLPMDDRLLANLAGFGRDLDGWRGVKERALHGFIECSDGRIYHPVVAEKARTAWDKKFDRPDRAQERSEHAQKAAQARWANERAAATLAEPERVPEQSSNEAAAMPEHCSSPALKGQEGKGTKAKNHTDDAARAGAIMRDAIELADEIMEIVGQDPRNPEPTWCGAAYRVQQWIAKGWSNGLVIASVNQQVARRAGASPVRSIEYFEPGIAEFISRNQAPLPTVKALPGKAVEVYGGSNLKQVRDDRSGIAAIDRVFDHLRSA